MSSQSNGNRDTAENAANGADRPTHHHHGHQPDVEGSGSTDSSGAVVQPGGFPAVGKAMEPLTQPVNYAIKGTTRALNTTVGVTTSVANGLVTGTTSILGHTAEAALPKGVFSPSPRCCNPHGAVLTFVCRQRQTGQKPHRWLRQDHDVGDAGCPQDDGVCH
jgi:hypothetical protein